MRNAVRGVVTEGGTAWIFCPCVRGRVCGRARDKRDGGEEHPCWG